MRKTVWTTICTLIFTTHVHGASLDDVSVVDFEILVNGCVEAMIEAKHVSYKKAHKLCKCSIAGVLSRHSIEDMKQQTKEYREYGLMVARECLRVHG